MSTLLAATLFFASGALCVVALARAANAIDDWRPEAVLSAVTFLLAVVFIGSST